MICDDVVKHYRQRDKVQKYDITRFSTSGGRLVEQKEQEIVQKFSTRIASHGSLLDLGTGTGRMAVSIQSNMKVGVDSSFPMLQKAKNKNLDVICCDLLHLPFRRATFSIAIAIRVLIREKKLLSVFRETARVLGEGGCFVFDTSNKCSVGRFLNFFSQEPKHEMFLSTEITRMLKMSSFKDVQMESAFMIPRGLYQKIDGQLVRALWKIDTIALKTRLKQIACTHFWKSSLTSKEVA